MHEHGPAVPCAPSVARLRRFGTALGVCLGTIVACSRASFIPPHTSESSFRPSGSARPDYARVAPTRSLALDRVTKQSATLDGTVHRVGTGRGVTVYLFDGGVNAEHVELAGRVRRGFDASPDDAGPCNAHGTAVAGAIGGTSLGVAPEARIVDVKIFECRGMSGSIRSIVKATDWVIRDHREHPGPAVVNWSFVVDTLHDVLPIDTAVSRLLDAGMLVVVAAGNMNRDACQMSPGNAPGTLVVGGLMLAWDLGSHAWVDQYVAGTAWGPCVDVYAPADSVLLPLGSGRTGAGLFSGTSFAAGYASGAAAVLLEQSPDLSPEQLRQRICARTSLTRLVNLPHQLPIQPSRALYIGPWTDPAPARAPQRLATRSKACESRPTLEAPGYRR